MKRPENYNTKQSEAILSYISSLGGAHVTVGQVVEHFEEKNFPVGLTTVYRHLDKLVDSGKVRKYNIDGVTGACYQYVNGGDDCQEHFHLKCECCGKLLHLQCGLLDKIEQHISEEHTFQINTMKTVFYGRCKGCQNND